MQNTLSKKSNSQAIDLITTQTLQTKIMELELANKNLIKKNEILSQDLRKVLGFLNTPNKAHQKLIKLAKELQSYTIKNKI